ncbi:MAG: ABC transporter permease [Anaerolineaceae bacterium]|nr:ABC transporter permease [Anaerolineaceae bacterium]
MATVDSQTANQTVVLKPAKGWLGVDLKELWYYRELVYFLTWRDIKVRYKQAALGIAWVILQPLITALVSTFVFSRGLKIDSGSLPYPLFVLSAYLPWHLFANSLTKSSSSLVGNANLITKVYFPRIIIPLASVLSSLLDFFISLVILLIAMVIYKAPITLTALWIIPFSVLAMIIALAVGLWFSALNVQYRDVQQILPFISQIWLYITPVLYPINIGNNPIFKAIYNLNPMVGVVQGFRWALFGGTQPDATIWISGAAILLLFISGIYFFRRMEKTFADVV